MIGVILMVAITVILAAVIGTFVLGLGDGLATAPTAQVDSTVDSDEVVFRHTGGQNIDGANLQIVSSNGNVTVDSATTSGEYATGSAVRSGLTNTGDSTDETTVSLVWNDGSTSSTLATVDVDVTADGGVSLA